MKAFEIVKRFEALRAERRNLDGTYDLVDRFVVPGKGRLYTTDEESNVDYTQRDRYEDTAVLAAQTLSSSIHGAITNPAHKWFSFQFRDIALNDSKVSSEWLQMCEDITYQFIVDSNFPTEVTEYYLNDVSFGTALMSHLTVDNRFVFKNLDIKGAYFEEDIHGNINGLFKEHEYTALQLVDRFGVDRVPHVVRAQAINPSACNTKHSVIHAIYFEPNNRRSNTAILLARRLRPYQERYVFKSDNTVLEVGGYYEMPAYLLRWGMIAGSKFGYSPAINSMGNILTLNQLVELVLRAAEKAVDPNILMLERGVIGNANLRAGGSTVVRDMDAMRAFESRARFDVSQLEKRDLIQAVRQAFFVDQLELKESPAMTATEVQVRYELMQRLIGPPVARIKSDFLDKLLHRSFFSLSRMGMLPEPPAEVTDINAQYDIEYVGSWSRSQRMDEVAALEGSMQSLAQIAALSPAFQEEIMDTVDITSVARDIAIKRGMPAKHLRPEKEVKERQKQRQEEQQQMKEMAMLQQGASAAKDLGASGLGQPQQQQ
jgi:hypothetical protein